MRDRSILPGDWRQSSFSRVKWLAAAIFALAILCAGCSAERVRTGNAIAPAGGESSEAEGGIQPLHLRLTTRGMMLDFRYRVIDPEKAARLLGSEVRPYLVDEATGSILVVPDAPKIGAIRSTTRNPAAGQEHFILFANPNRILKQGSKVVVVIGDFKVADIVVE